MLRIPPLDKDKDEFCNIIQQEITKLPRKCRGDFNGKIGKTVWKNWPNNFGKFTTGNMYENGERLLQFCTINDLGIVNTM